MVQGILINRLVAEMRLYEVGFKRFKKQMQALPSLEKFAPKADSSFDPKDDNYYRYAAGAPVIPLPNVLTRGLLLFFVAHSLISYNKRFPQALCSRTVPVQVSSGIVEG